MEKEMKVIEMTTRCSHPHPRIMGQRCNAKICIGSTGGQVVVACWRCDNPVTLNFEESDTDVLTGVKIMESRVRFVDKGIMRV